MKMSVSRAIRPFKCWTVVRNLPCSQNHVFDMLGSQGGIHTCYVLQSSPAVKLQVSSLLEIFSIDNGKATTSL